MRSRPLLVVLALPVAVLAWGYWYASQHASLQINANDHALKTPHRIYAPAQGVQLVFRDSARQTLARAASVEPHGLVLAQHPDPAIGNCHQHGHGDAYVACYKRYAAWTAQWAPRVHSADVAVGHCRLGGAPVTVRRSHGDWWLWWVPLPHVGGLPRQHIDLVIAIDSKNCRAVP